MDALFWFVGMFICALVGLFLLSLLLVFLWVAGCAAVWLRRLEKARGPLPASLSWFTAMRYAMRHQTDRVYTSTMAEPVYWPVTGRSSWERREAERREDERAEDARRAAARERHLRTGWPTIDEC